MGTLRLDVNVDHIATLLTSHPGRFVTAAEDSVVDLRRVRFAGVESHPNILRVRISDDFFHAIDSHQRFAQGTDAFVAIIPLRRDIDPFPNRLISGVV
jgi:hypothetical protein